MKTPSHPTQPLSSSAPPPAEHVCWANKRITQSPNLLRNVLMAEINAHGGCFATYRNLTELPMFDRLEEDFSSELLDLAERAREALVSSPSGVATMFKPFPVCEPVFLAGDFDVSELIDAGFYHRSRFDLEKNGGVQCSEETPTMPLHATMFTNHLLVREAAAQVGLSERSLRRLIASGKGPRTIKDGAKPALIHPDDLRVWSDSTKATCPGTVKCTGFR